MPIAPLLVAYLCCASLSLGGLAFLLYRYERHSPEPQNMARITVCVGMVALAFAVLVWMNPRVAPPVAVTAPLSTHAEAQPWLSPEQVHVQD